MEQPRGFEDASQPTLVWKIHKAVYDLKQTPRAWFNQLKHYLVTYGFRARQSDIFFLYTTPFHCWYCVHSCLCWWLNNYMYQLHIHLDHDRQPVQLVLSQRSWKSTLISWCPNHSYTKWHHYLTTKIQWIHPSQEQNAWFKTNHHSCWSIHQTNPPWRPICRSKTISPKSWSITVRHHHMAWHWLCSQTYLSIYALTYNSTLASRQVYLRYLNGTLTHCLHSTSQKTEFLLAYSDSGWMLDSDEYRSQYGFTIFHGHNLIVGPLVSNKLLPAQARKRNTRP